MFLAGMSECPVDADLRLDLLQIPLCLLVDLNHLFELLNTDPLLLLQFLLELLPLVQRHYLLQHSVVFLRVLNLILLLIIVVLLIILLVFIIL